MGDRRSGHIDAAIVAFVVLALAAAVDGRRAWSGAALAAATLVKFFPLVLVPALWRPAKSNRGDCDGRLLSSPSSLPLTCPTSGWALASLGFLPGYVAEEGLVSGTGFWVLDMIRRAVPRALAAYLGLSITVMAGLTDRRFASAGRPGLELPWTTALATAALFFASPHYPWYFVCLVALLTVAPWWPAWWLTLTAVLLYWDARTGHVPFWAGFTIYGGFVILCGVELARRSLFAARSGAQHDVDRAI